MKHAWKALAIAATCLVFGASSARADTIWMCGHEIKTGYTADGWVLLQSVSGVDFNHQHPEIVVYGQASYGFDRMPVIASIFAGVKWGWLNSRVAIEGFDDCRDEAHCCTVILH